MNLNKYFHDFKSKRILIVGDAIIDTYLWGEINRMSPEAPVPVVDVAVNQNDSRLGGAANVALNLKELDAEFIVTNHYYQDYYFKEKNYIFNRHPEFVKDYLDKNFNLIYEIKSNNVRINSIYKR